MKVKIVETYKICKEIGSILKPVILVGGKQYPMFDTVV